MKDKKPSKDLEDYISYSKHLEKSNHELKKELEKLRQLFGAGRKQLEEKVSSLYNEIDRLREPPLVVAVIVKLDEETGNVIVLSSTGPMFVVKPSRKVRKANLEPGMFVSLNQRTFAIMEILSVTSEDVRSARSLFYEED